jgi:hypothetical protein
MGEIVYPFGFQLATVLSEVSENCAVDMDALFFALMKLVPHDVPADQFDEPSAKLIEDCKNVFEHFKGGTDLDPIWVETSFESVQAWMGRLHFQCPGWERSFAFAIGCEADLTIQVEMTDERMGVYFPQLSYLEVADLLALRNATEDYWKAPATWLGLQDRKWKRSCDGD